MGMHAFLVSLPAIVALLFKGAIFLYARSSAVRTQQTRLYLYFLFAFSVQNIAEIFGFHVLIDQGVIPHLEATLFYAAVIAALALLMDLVLRTAFTGEGWHERVVIRSYYGYAVVLELLLLLTPWLIEGYTPLNYSVTRIAGPLYFLFEMYAVGGFLAIVGGLIYGARHADSAFRRAQNKVLLLAIAPLAVTAIAVVSLLHLRISWVNASVTFPIAITYFLAVTAYAIHQHRLFDIEFIIPWSNVRRRKTAFYRRIEAMVAEIASVNNVDQAVDRLANTLGCAAALVGGDRPVVAAAGGSRLMARIPRDTLRRFDHIVVAHEIAATLPDVHRTMQRHGVAAIVPFHPHSQHAAAWLVLGKAFSEQVYTVRDFRAVEQLFAKLADLFLDQLVTMRAQLAVAAGRIDAFEREQRALRAKVELLQQENAILAGHNELLRRQPLDSLGVTALPAETAPRVVILGRDKARVKTLRRTFPQATHYVSAASSGLKRLDAPEVLVADLSENSGADVAALAAWLGEEPSSALLLTGAGAEAFAATADFCGRLVEIAPATDDSETLAERIQPLAQLRRATHALNDPEQPLLGRSAAFTALLAEARRVAAMADALVLRTDDSGQGLALAAFIHGAGHGGSSYVAWTSQDPATADKLAAAAGGTLAVEWDSLSYDARTTVTAALLARRDVRLVVVASLGAQVDLGPVRPRVLTLPPLPARHADLPLLVHYFRLTSNLRSGSHRNFSEAEVDALWRGNCPSTVSELSRRVRAALTTPLPTAINGATPPMPLREKTLDEHIAEYEAHIIRETLERCGGNKSQAARLLGLRPNTLHYKMARHARDRDR